MVLVIDATVAGATANSYVALIDAQVIIDSLFSPTETDAWDSATPDTQNRALATATARLDEEMWLGARSTDIQALDWPRQGVMKPDGRYYSNIAGFRYNQGSSQAFYTDSEIPPEIKRATVLLAAFLIANPEILSLTGLEQFEEVKVGPLMVRPSQPQKNAQLPPAVTRLLNGLRLGGSSNVSLARG